MNRRQFIAALTASSLVPALAARGQAPTTVTVFAAASLTDALNDIAKLWVAKGEPMPSLSYAASSTLARQIEQGAPANIFASADERWMDWAQTRNLIVPATRRTLLSNELVMVAPAGSARPVKIPGTDLVSLLGEHGRIATGDPASVPVGLYAKQALTKMGQWDAVDPRLARADSVRSALLLVERGEAPFGIVYATDAAVAPRVAIVGTFPADLHDPIAYPFAVTRSGDTPSARGLLDFLSGPQAMEVFRRYGFTTPKA